MNKTKCECFEIVKDHGPSSFCLKTFDTFRYSSQEHINFGNFTVEDLLSSTEKLPKLAPATKSDTLPCLNSNCLNCLHGELQQKNQKILM